MSIFQCDNCGCAENTATGWYHCRNNERLTKKEFLGKKLCSACAPTEYPSGEKVKGAGAWHGEFARVYLPKGECFTNKVGDLEHESGISGGDLYDKLGRDTEYN